MIAHAAVERPLTGEPASIALVEPDEPDSARQQLVGVQTLNPHARPRQSLRPLHRAPPGRPASRSDRCKSHRANRLRIRRGEHFALPIRTQYVCAAVVIQPLAGTWPRRLRARERRQPAVGPGARTWLTSSGQQVHRRSGPPGIRRAVTADRFEGDPGSAADVVN